jgi:hypothetical protein
LAEREGLGERIRVGENHRWISRLAWWSGRGAEARAAAIRAVDVLGRGEPSRELAMAYSNRSQLHMLAHELAEAVTWGERARELADRLGDLDTSIHASVNVGAARLLGGDPAAVAALREAHVAASAAGLVDHAARALVSRAASLVETCDYHAAAAALDEALRYAAAHDLDGYLQYLLVVRAAIRWTVRLVRGTRRCGRGVERPVQRRRRRHGSGGTGRILAAR